MNKSMRTLLSILLVFCMVLQWAPAAAFAAETEVWDTSEVYAEETVPDTDLPDNDELFAMYVEQTLYDTQRATFGTAARENLNPVEQAIYDQLKTAIEAVAAQGGTTEFTLSEVSGLKTEWTREELGVESIEDITEAKAQFTAQFTQRKIIRALLSDCPFDLYWFDKTAASGIGYSVRRSGISVDGTTYWTKVIFSDLTATFRVAPGYQDGSDTVVTSEVAKVNTAKTNAQAIAQAHASDTAYEKLVAYRDEICNLVEYNDDAISPDYSDGYGDPWQLIYVFDGDDTTKVVCEGYSKAFQYLCDLSGLACISVTGDMAFDDQGGGHMWNIVTMNGGNYLVDVTNYDSNFTMLFMAGTAIGSVAEGYSFPTYTGYPDIVFTYDDFATTVWTEEELTLAAENFDPNAVPVCPHNYESVVTAPTCTAGGFTTYTCTLCGDSYTDSQTAALGHAEETVPGYAATCTEAGLTDGVKCTVCNEILTAQAEIAALGHTEETVHGYAATCTETGLTDGVKCTVCNEILTAQEEIPALGHRYENGVCAVCGSGVIRNADTDDTFASLADALAAVQEGQTLQLCSDWNEARIMVTPGVTLDLNGYTLTAEYLVGFETAHVVDDVGTGRLNAAMKNVVLDEGNRMVPVYDGQGYVFTKAGFALRQDSAYTGEGIKINALATPTRMDVVELLKDGGADNHIEIMLLLSWDTAEGTGSQEFVFTDQVVGDVYASNQGKWNSYSQMFSMTITGFGSIENLRAQMVVVSGTNVRYISSASVSIT